MQIMDHIYETEDEGSMVVEVVVYNHEASSLTMTKNTYKDVINQTQASAKTCFASAFDCIRGTSSCAPVVTSLQPRRLTLTLAALDVP
jgi:hypothetical protein